MTGPPTARAPARPLDRAIFVGGMPRSGTSLMRTILAAHPAVAMFPGELPLWRQLAPAYAGRDLARADVRARLVRDLVGHPSVARAQVTLDGEALTAALAAEPAVTLGAVFAHALRQYARQAGKPRWGVKDPRTEFHGDRLRAELPAADVIHMLRDPRDVLASQRATWGRAAQHIVSTVDDWRRSAALARRRRDAGRPAYLAVRYEDLVAEPEGVVRGICRALDLDYRAEMIDTAGRELWPARDAAAPESAVLARAISPLAVGRHRGEVAPGESRYIEWRAGREMAAWGYHPGTAIARRAWPGVARCLGEEAAWRTLRALRIWPRLSRALGRAIQ